MFEIEICRTEELSDKVRAELRSMLEHTFGPRYEDIAWHHCLGGTHFLLRYKGVLASHVSLVPRLLEQDGREYRGVYGESMATIPELQGKGIGSIVAAMATADILLHYEIGAFAASKYHFYERLGWRKWSGQTYVKSGTGKEPASPDRGAVMALLPEGSAIDPDGELVTDWREGDIW